MTIGITWNGNCGSEQRIAAIINTAATSLGLQDGVTLFGANGSGQSPSVAPQGIVFTEIPDPDIARYLIARAAGIRTILFVCTGNAMRSQIAEALVNHLFRGQWAAFSAGVLPMDMPGNVAAVMREIGVDMTGHRPKHVELFGTCSFDMIVILCSDADRICPNLPDCIVQDHLFFDDPLASSMISEGAIFSLKASLRDLRDEMRKRIPAYLKGR